MATASTLRELIEERVMAFYQSFAEGRDVAPANQFRTEGLMEAALLQGLVSEHELQLLKQDCYKKVFDQVLPEHSLGEASQLLTLMKRAPVFPSTPD